MLWKYKETFNLLQTLQNSVIFAFSSFYQKEESTLTAVEKREMLQDTMLVVLDLGLTVQKASEASILSVGCNSLLPSRL